MGIHLDVGCGANKQKGFTGMDKRNLPGVDIVHDAEVFPWPIEDGACSIIVMSHFVEHVKPWLSIDLINECWRVLEIEGALLISTPYAGSFRYFQDPTHCNPWNVATPAYFDPENGLWSVYKPKPWKVTKMYYQVAGDLEVAMEKRGEDGSEDLQQQMGKEGTDLDTYVGNRKVRVGSRPVQPSSSGELGV